MFDTGTGAARRNFLEHTMHVSVFLRHGGALVVYAVVLVSAPRISVAGVVFAGLAGAWSLYRLLTRSATPRIIAIDYAVTLAACLVLPVAAARVSGRAGGIGAGPGVHLRRSPARGLPGPRSGRAGRSRASARSSHVRR